MIGVCTGDFIVQWVNERMPHKDIGFNNPVGVGFIKDNVLVGGVVYDNYLPQLKSICASIALDKPILNKTILKQLFSYPFETLGVNRINCNIESNNTASIKLCSRLGFGHEGTMRKASPDGRDILIFGMLKEECKWL